MILKHWKFLHTDCEKRLQESLDSRDKRLDIAQDEAKFWHGKALEAQAMFDYQTKELENKIEELSKTTKGDHVIRKMRAAEARERYHRKEVAGLNADISNLEKELSKEIRFEWIDCNKAQPNYKDYKLVLLTDGQEVYLGVKGEVTKLIGAKSGRDYYYPKRMTHWCAIEGVSLPQIVNESAKVSTSADKKLSNGLKDHKNRPYKFDKEIKDMVNIALNNVKGPIVGASPKRKPGRPRNP